MAAWTSAITALAGLGLSAYQAVDSKKKEEQADQAAKSARAAMANVKEQNAMAALQTPDITAYERQQQARTTATAIDSLKGAGAEGAFQTVALTETARDAALDTAQRQAQAEFQTDAMIKGAQQGINQRQATADREMAYMDLMGAQAASLEARQNKNAAIGSAVSSAGQAINAAGQAAPLYGKQPVNEAVNTQAVDPNFMQAPGAPTVTSQPYYGVQVQPQQSNVLDWSMLSGTTPTFYNR